MAIEEPTDEISDLNQVYALLQRDAKLLITDLNEGVSLWRLSGRLMLYLAIIGFFLAYIAQYPQSPPGLWRLAAVLAGLGLGVSAGVGAALSERKYSRLKRKYGELFKAAKKLS